MGYVEYDGAGGTYAATVPTPAMLGCLASTTTRHISVIFLAIGVAPI